MLISSQTFNASMLLFKSDGYEHLNMFFLLTN